MFLNERLFHLVKLYTDHLGSKCVLLVCCKTIEWFRWRRITSRSPVIHQWNQFQWVWMLFLLLHCYFNYCFIIIFSSVRSSLLSIYDPMNNSGTLLSFFLGNYLSHLDQARTYLIMPIIFSIIWFFLPELPEFWIKRGQREVHDIFQLILKFFQIIVSISEGNQFVQIL